MIGRLTQTLDFKRLLATVPRWRSAHFVVHHLDVMPSRPASSQRRTGSSKLSTNSQRLLSQHVDKSPGLSLPGIPLAADGSNDLAPVEGSERLAEQAKSFRAASMWLGCVVPKRLARRAVTRNLMRRQMRAAAFGHASDLGRGLWLIRLRAPFPVALYPSAASNSLRQAVRTELESLMSSVGDVTGRRR